jgi:hypothetical protein
VVLGDGDVVILKAIKAPDLSEFDELVGRAEAAARAAAMPPAGPGRQSPAGEWQDLAGSGGRVSILSPSSELSGARGVPHCLIHPLLRDPA